MPALPSSSVGTVDTGPSEVVIRPTGLRHGRWEAPQWAFFTMGAIVVVAALVYALIRMGTLDVSRFRKKKT